MFNFSNFKKNIKNNSFSVNYFFMNFVTIVIYFIFFTFLSFLIKLFSNDFLDKKIYKNKKSYWKLRVKKINSMKKQY